MLSEQIVESYPIIARLFNEGSLIGDSQTATLQDAEQCAAAARKINTCFQEKIAPNFSAVHIANTDWQLILKNMQKLQTAMDKVSQGKPGLLGPSITLVQTNLAKNRLAKLQEELRGAHQNPQEIQGLLTNVKMLMTSFPHLSSTLTALEHALTLLLDPKAFTEKPVETLPYNGAFVSSFANMAKNEVFKCLKTVDLHKGDAATLIKQAYSDASISALRNRIKSALPNATPLAVEDEVHAILALNRMQKKLESYVDFLATSIHEGNDAKCKKLGEKRFSTLIQNSSNSIPAHRASLVEAALTAFRAQLVTLRRKPDFQQHLRTEEAHLEEALKEVISDAILAHITPFYDWLLANIDNVKVSYDQACDPSRNMGDGSCFENSIDRLILLRKTPSLAAGQIKMSSSKRGRVAQARNNAQEKNFAQQVAATENQFNVVATKSPIKGSKNYVVDRLLKEAEGRPVSGILYLGGQAGGHAINIQIDPKKGVFRFIDDNCGVLEYSSKEAFSLQISRYLSIQYKTYDHFELVTFT